MPILTKAEKERKGIALAMAFRRAILNSRARDEKAGAKRAGKAQARPEKAMIYRERTNRLAAERIEGCQNHPSPFAARQLASIAARDDLNAANRIEVAATFLDWGHADANLMNVAAERRGARPSRKPKARPVADRLANLG